MSIMIITNQKSIVDIHIHKRERNSNITLKIVIKITRQENKRFQGILLSSSM